MAALDYGKYILVSLPHLDPHLGLWIPHATVYSQAEDYRAHFHRFTSLKKTFLTEEEALSVHKVKSTQRTPEGYMAKKQTQEDKTDIAIAAMIEEVEHYSLTHMFRAIRDGGGNSDSRDSIEISKFTSFGEIPFSKRMKENRDELDANINILRKGFPTGDVEVGRALEEIESLTSVIACDAERVGYYLGVMMGAKLFGATRAHLEELGRGLKAEL